MYPGDGSLHWHGPLFGYFRDIHMQITVNNKETQTQAPNIAELAREMGLPELGVAIAVGTQMVPRAEWATTALKEGDKVIIIKAACGG